MAKKVLTSLDLVLNQLLNARLQQVPGNPSTLTESLFWYNSSTKRPMFYNGTEAKNFGIEYQAGTGIDITNEVISVDFDDVATAAQGSLADTAIQPNDNISELNNDVGYIATSNLSTGFTNTSGTITVTDYDKLIKNTATGNNSYTIGGNSTSGSGAINIGTYSRATTESVAIGHSAKTSSESAYNQNVAVGCDAETRNGKQNVALGYNAKASNTGSSGGYNCTAIGAYATASASRSIQLGAGTNSTENTLAVGFGRDASDNALEYTLLDGATGLIPDARLSSNIARLSDIPTVPTKISDLTDDTATCPIDKADTLTGLTATITELNYTDGVTSSIQTQLNGKQATIDSSHKLLSDLVDDTNQTNKFATSFQLSQISTNKSDISTINGKIPSQASSSNQLADKDFVNSSISTNTAYFDGTWDTYALIPTAVTGFTSLGLPEPTNNNYLVVKEDETQDGGTWRYKYVDDGTAYNKNKWHVEYEVNETPLTAAQLAALNSGITAETKVTHTSGTAIGSETKGVYVDANGNATAMTYSVGKDVPSNAVFTDTTYTFATGSTNGTISVTPSGGSASDVSVKGLGSAAYTDSTSYATSAQGTKADNSAQRYSTTNPALTASGGLCTWTVTHGLGRQFVQVKVYETSTGEEVITDVICTSTTVATVKINSSTNISAGAYTVVVQG